MKGKTKIWIAIAVIIFAGVVIYNASDKSPSSGEFDTFAKCLSDNNVKMFGAYWCPHCENQKKMFGDSWDNINYVECAIPNGGQNPVCIREGINSYPVWEFADGERAEGEQTMEQLAERSGCELVKDEAGE